MSLSTILNNSRPNKYPLANVMQSLNHPQIIKNLVFVFTLFSASLFSIKRPMLLIIKHTLPPLKWIAKSPNSIKEPCYYLQSEKKICLARQFKLLRNHIQASKIPSEMEVAPRYNCWNCWHCLWGFGAKCWLDGVEWTGYPLDCYDY